MRLLLAALLLLFVVPLASVIVQAFTGSEPDVLAHLVDTVLARYVGGTVGLLLLVLPGVTAIGAGCAWLVTMCRFPGSRVFEWALLLPFAAPTYILAYVYTDALQGAVPGIRSLPMAALLFVLTLYPYVFLLARASFLEQSFCVWEASRTLGCSPGESFRRVALPLARPSIVAGAALALMEVAGDFGTVEYFAVDTFSTGVYRAWFGMGNKAAAAQLSLFLLGFVLLLLFAERTSRRRQRYGHTTSRYRRLTPFTLVGRQAVLAVLACAVPIVFGFVVPAALLAARVTRGGFQRVDGSFFALAGRSFLLAVGAALLCCAAGLLLAWGARTLRGRVAQASVSIASLSYSFPGAVLAVGVLFPLAALDETVADAVMRLTGHDLGMLLSGTAGALLYAYTVRFGAVPLQGFSAALSRVTPSMEFSARVLGATSLATLRRVFMPLMRGSLLAALAIVFVDVVRELPATMVLRPFNFDTLAVYTHRLASDERLTEASPAALLIVVVGIIPVALLSRSLRASRPGAPTP